MSKDLNLSLDSSLIASQPETPSARQGKSQRQKAPALTPGGNRPGTNARQGLATVIACAIFAINAAFLLWAGYWLTEQQQSREPVAIEVDTTELVSTLTPTLQNLSAETQSLQEEVNQLYLQLAEQRQLLADSHHIITARLEEALEKKPVSAISPALTPTAKLPPKNWYVNLGTFSTDIAAKKLQQQIKALGYSAVITSVKLDNMSAYRVQLPGFSDHESAEATAQKIMQQTDLNGLWAWQNN